MNLILTRTRTLALTPTRTLTRTHTRAPTPTLTRTRTLTLARTRTRTRTRTHTLTFTLTSVITPTLGLFAQTHVSQQIWSLLHTLRMMVWFYAMCGGDHEIRGYAQVPLRLRFGSGLGLACGCSWVVFLVFGVRSFGLSVFCF